MKIRPKAEGITEPPESSVSDTLLYIAGDFDSKDTQLRVIPKDCVSNRGKGESFYNDAIYGWISLYHS